MSPGQTMSLGDTLLQLLFRFIVSTVYGAYVPRSYVGSDGLLRQHFPENVWIIIIIILLLLLLVVLVIIVPLLLDDYRILMTSYRQKKSVFSLKHILC